MSGAAAFGPSGRPLEAGASFVLSWFYGSATPIDSPLFVAPRACRVLSVKHRPLGTAAGATIDIKKAPSGTALASGTSVLAAPLAADATTDTNATVTLSATAAALSLAAGDALGMDVNGTLTSATGAITIELCWLA